MDERRAVVHPNIVEEAAEVAAEAVVGHDPLAADATEDNELAADQRTISTSALQRITAVITTGGAHLAADHVRRVARARARPAGMRLEPAPAGW